MKSFPILFLLVVLSNCVSPNTVKVANPSTEALLDSIRAFEYSNVFKTRELASQLLQIDDERAQVYGEFYHLLSYCNQSNTPEIRDSLDQLYNRIVNNSEYADIRLKIDFAFIEHYYGIGDVGSASERIQKSFEFLTDPELDLERSTLIYGISRHQPYYSREQSYSEIQSILSEPQYKGQWTWNIARLHLIQALNEYKLNRSKRAKRLLLEGIKKNTEHNILSLNTEFLLQLSILHLNTNADKAFEYLNRAIKNAEETGFTSNIMLLFRTMGHFNIEIHKDFKQAFYFYSQAMKGDSIASRLNTLATDMGFAGWAYFKMNPDTNLDSAEVYWEKSIEIAYSLETQDYTSLIMTNQRKLWAYGKVGYKSRLAPLKELIAKYQLEQSNSKAKLQNLALNSMAEMTSISNKINLLTLSKKVADENVKMQTVLLFLVSLLALLISIFIYIYRKNLKEALLANETLSDRNSVIANQNEELKVKKSQLEAELKGRLSLLSTNLTRIEKINKELLEEPLIPQKVKKSFFTIINLEDTKRILEDIDLQLLGHNKEFYNKLTQRHPSLTKYNLKICLYLKMNLSSKEIASLLSVSVDTVKVTRSRIRKKMNIGEKKTSLSSYLNSV